MQFNHVPSDIISDDMTDWKLINPILVYQCNFVTKILGNSLTLRRMV